MCPTADQKRELQITKEASVAFIERVWAGFLTGIFSSDDRSQLKAYGIPLRAASHEFHLEDEVGHRVRTLQSCF